MHVSEEVVDRPHCHLHVCTSCRERGAPREPAEKRAGYRLYQELRSAIEGSPLSKRVSVRPTPCLSICPRPCGIALSLEGSWTYLFGDQVPEKTTRDIIHALLLYLRSPEGFMPRDQRPSALQRSILGRVPPAVGGERCI